MNDSPPEPALDQVRREIDRVDETILSLLAERLRLGDSIVALKTPETGLPIRPGREVNLLRRLIAAAPAPLERELVLEVWRALIAANLRRQRVIDVAVGGARSDPTRLFDIARRHFGARTRIHYVGDAQSALQRAAENPDRWVAVTPWPAAPGVGSWWPALSEARFGGLQAIAGLPLLGPASEDPEGCVFAASDAEEAGGDVSLLMVFDEHFRVQQALKEVGLAGRELARSPPRVLLRIEGFLARDDARAAALVANGLQRARVIGAYARV